MVLLTSSRAASRSSRRTARLPSAFQVVLTTVKVELALVSARSCTSFLTAFSCTSLSLKSLFLA